MLQGVPGSGKTRAMYQLLANPKVIGCEKKANFALGFLAEKKVIVVNQENVKQVKEFLQWEMERRGKLIRQEGRDYADKYYADESKCFYLLCDQLKDVFGILHEPKDLYDFFDNLIQLPHVRMIATSIPSAFRSFCERWEIHGYNPFEDDRLTNSILIPQISQDLDSEMIRNWIQSELHANTYAETFGDYIPGLNDYKQGIARLLYSKQEEKPYLGYFLKAMQIVETYRHATPLYLPILIARFLARKSVMNEAPIDEIIQTINYLICINFIRVTSRDAVCGKILREMFDLDPDIDEDDFIYDGECFKDAEISTSYNYSVNEIVWDYLKKEDANRHLKAQVGEVPLLLDFDNVRDVVRSAKQFYKSIGKVSFLRRILPRVPHTDCYDAAVAELWNFVFKELNSSELNIDDQEEFVVTIGMLIGRSKNVAQIKDSIGILYQKNITPDYNIIGELYSAGARLGLGEKKEIKAMIDSLRSQASLNEDSFFSMDRRIRFEKLDFAAIKSKVKNSQYTVGTECGMLLKDIGPQLDNGKEKFSLGQLLANIGKYAENVEQWMDVLDLYKLAGVYVQRKMFRQCFAVLSDEQKRLGGNVLEDNLKRILTDYADCIIKDDEESVYFYSIDKSRNFKQALSIYSDYKKKFQKHNPRLISMALHTVQSNEFQTAVNFLVETNENLSKQNGLQLSVICYNNLIKKAPNVSEAMEVVSYMPYIQEQTVVNVLNVLKRRKIYDSNSKTGKKDDPKVFYYAYSVIMHNRFRDFRSSPYVIGCLYNLATTLKHEDFIRNKFLYEALGGDGLSKEKMEGELHKLVDCSTGITSLRLQKNYRTLDTMWEIFNKCRDYYYMHKLYVNSDIYNNMMRKIWFFCSEDQISLDANMAKMSAIIKQDESYIVHDEYYYSSLYRFLPEKHVVDGDGHVTEDFVRDIRKSNILHVKPLNNVMGMLRERGFDVVWNFYELIVDYYKIRGRQEELRPDIYTVTYLMETVKTEGQLVKSKEVAEFWMPNMPIDTNRIYHMAYDDALRRIGKTPERLVEKKDDAQEFGEEIVEPEYDINRRDYRKETDEIINMAHRDIYLYGSLTASRLNQYLRKFLNIKDDMFKDKDMRMDISRKCSKGLYWNVYNNLIKDRKEIGFDSNSYISLMKLAPNDSEAVVWIKKILDLKEDCKYQMSVCREMATSIEVARYDIYISFEFFGYWEKIMDDIGYDPADSQSFSEQSEKVQYGNIVDCDYYWKTRHNHILREMNHYFYMKSRNQIDKVALEFIKEQMALYDQYNLEFPTFKKSDVDFYEEVNEQLK